MHYLHDVTSLHMLMYVFQFTYIVKYLGCWFRRCLCVLAQASNSVYSGRNKYIQNNKKPIIRLAFKSLLSSLLSFSVSSTSPKPKKKPKHQRGCYSFQNHIRLSYTFHLSQIKKIIHSIISHKFKATFSLKNTIMDTAISS